jgi:hypothetical protein
MSPQDSATDLPNVARIPADIDTPDKIVYGLTARQLAIGAVAAAVAYLLYRTAGWRLPAPALVAVMLPIAGAAIVLVFGRRDGLPFDAWLAAAAGFYAAPKRLTPTVAPLTLPAAQINDVGVIDAGDRKVVLVAATTVNLALQTSAEQAGLVGGFARWLHSLTGPVQLVVSTQRVDLASHAARTADAAETMSSPGLAALAGDYAGFLDQLAAGRDPLCRTVTVAVTAPAGSPSADREVRQRAAHTAAALQALGVRAAVLDGGRATAVLICAVDPYSPVDTSWPRGTPGAVITTDPPPQGVST